jgi:putative Mg2+ transporter-C (MgtC) family protein
MPGCSEARKAGCSSDVAEGAAILTMSEAELVGRVALATALGALVGVERELTDKAAGLRTHALVALGAAAFTVAGFAVLQAPGSAQFKPDVGRIAAQVASGIGFIGAGLIILQGRKLRGLTTAGLCAVAGIGVLAGLGFLIVASATTGLVISVVAGVRVVEHVLYRHRSSPSQTDGSGDEAGNGPGG